MSAPLPNRAEKADSTFCEVIRVVNRHALFFIKVEKQEVLRVAAEQVKGFFESRLHLGNGDFVD